MIKLMPKFKCPECGKYIIARVMDTRIDFGGVLRRRICEDCGRTFYTKERIDHVTRIRKE
jgi:transcriptional regulator NrdR family protein